MKDLKNILNGNYSQTGKFTAKLYSYIIDKSAHADKILKDKPRKKIVEKSYLERTDNDNLDDKSDEKDYIDIFNENYKNRQNELTEYQRNKLFNYMRSCAINKKYISEENKDNSEYEKRYRYHLLHHMHSDNKKPIEDHGKLIALDNNINNNNNLHKIVYSQSFYKMVGRDDQEKLKKNIEKKLEEKSKNVKNNKTFEHNQNILSTSIKKSIKKRKNKHKKINIRGVGMDKQLQRGILPEHHDVRIRTAKCLDIEYNNKYIKPISSSIISKNNSFKNLKNKKINRIFSSVLPNNNLLINDNKNTDEKNDINEKRIFSGFSSMKNLTLKRHPKSSLENTIKYDYNFNSELENGLSLFEFNKIKRRLYSNKNKSYSSLFKRSKSKFRKSRLFSSPLNNKAISFKKMLSREYINRERVNDKIGAGQPYTPNYNIIFPKTIMQVKYITKANHSKKKEFKGMIGEYLTEINKKNMTPKYNTLKKIQNFSKMFGRGTNMNSKFPIFMNNINTRNAFDFCLEKSLKMNNFSSGKLNNPFSSFNNRKSFNNIIISKNKERSKSIDNENYKKKESRLDYYNNNIDNIFKKVLYDKIVDDNIDNKNEENEELLDLKKNPLLAKTINLSYKNLISDYYRLNLDYLNKDSVKDKIDGVTFEVIKNNKFNSNSLSKKNNL